jgi:hypothetical protein
LAISSAGRGEDALPGACADEVFSEACAAEASVELASAQAETANAIVTNTAPGPTRAHLAG